MREDSDMVDGVDRVEGGGLKMSMFVKMFKPEFAELVRTGKKLQTIRPRPKRMPKVGDVVSLRRWADKPYRSKHVILGTRRINEVAVVDITENGIVVNSYAEPSDDIARADGFGNFFEMLEWFEREHGLPFEGIMIRWEPDLWSVSQSELDAIKAKRALE